MSTATFINVQPASPISRVYASGVARERGTGLRMEVHNMHTEFYADPKVPVGKCEVWSVRVYKGQLEFDCTLDDVSDPWPVPGSELEELLSV